MSDVLKACLKGSCEGGVGACGFQGERYWLAAERAEGRWYKYLGSHLGPCKSDRSTPGSMMGEMVTQQWYTGCITENTRSSLGLVILT